MALREIITVPHPALRKKARKVTDFGPKFQTLIDDMVESMRDAPGAGLAAPQVGVPLRLFIAEFGDEEDPEVPRKLHFIVNPEIVRHSRETEIGTEGCLSIPDLVGDVERYQAITVKYQDRYGKSTKIKADGWLARIFQHEIDHLHGILFTDLATEVWEPVTEEEKALID